MPLLRWPEEAEDHVIEHRVLGPLEVWAEGRPIDLGGRKQRLLLAVLLAHANHRVSTGRLVEALWGERAGGGAAHTLRVHVANLRKTLEPHHRPGAAWKAIETIEDGYRLRVDHGAFDRERFVGLADEGRALLREGVATAADVLREALALWRGDPYGELGSEAALEAEVVRLAELRLLAVEDRIDADLSLGRHQELVAELRDLVDLHPYRERLRGLLMLALYRAGRQAEARRAFRSLERVLGEELGLEPSPEVKELEERILLQDPSLDLVPAARPPATNLPAPTTSFVGRDGDVARVRRLVDGTRLLTFTGPGGVGKTRLAIEAAASLVERFPGGIWLVELAPLRDATLVGQAVAEALRIDQRPGRPVETTLVEALRDRCALLILDNCEHLIEGVPGLVDVLLRACRELRVWATSRETLGVGGETKLLVSGLALGERGRGPSDAVRLFVDRASSAVAGFALNAANSASVAQICRRLDGIPLAIELAAARVPVLSPQQIAGGLDRRFDLLTAGRRTAEPRQQTLKATVSWSYDLLTVPEQAVLRRLSVFRGGFDLAAVEALCGGVAGGPVLDLLAGLVAKSLVTVSPGGTEARYELLETIRLYARAELIAAEEESEALARHRDRFLQLAEEAGPGLRGVDQLVWLARLEADHDNLRAVLERAGEAGDIATALRIAGSIAWFWFLHSHLEEGWKRLDELIALSGDASTILRVRALIAAGQFAWEQSRDDEARQWLGEALRAADEIGSRSHTAWAHAYLGLLATLESRWDDGIRNAQEALRIFEATGNLAGFGFASWVEAGASYLSARGTKNAGSLVMAERIAGLLDMARQVGDRNLIGHLLWSLAIEAHDRHDSLAAERYLAEALVAFRELGNKSCAGHTLDQAASVALAQGHAKRAARLLAATEALRERLGIPGHVFEQRIWSQCRQRVVEALDPDDLEEAWSDGRHLSLEQAVDYALTGPSTSPAERG